MVTLAVTFGFWNWFKLIAAGMLAYFVYGMVSERMVKTTFWRIAVGASAVISLYLFYSLLSSFAAWWAEGPTGARLFAANTGHEKGCFIVDQQRHELAPGESIELDFREGTAPHRVVGQLGGKVVFDTLLGDGSYLGSLSAEREVYTEYIVYTNQYKPMRELPPSFSLRRPGIQLFSMDAVCAVYGFEETPPKAISVRSRSGATMGFYSVKMK